MLRRRCDPDASRESRSAASLLLLGVGLLQVGPDLRVGLFGRLRGLAAVADKLRTRLSATATKAVLLRDNTDKTTMRG